MSRRVLVLWSGGVESTSLLLRLLTTTDWMVFAHHIEMQNPEGRYLAERRAVSALRPHLESIRPFDFSDSFVSLCKGQAHAWDYAVQYSLGLSVMEYHRCDCILRAGCLEDDWDHFQHGERQWEQRLSEEPGFSHRRRARRLAASLGEDVDPNVLAPYLPSYALPKAAHIRYLGELATMTWSCRRPVRHYYPCGTCHACRERAAAQHGASAIPAVDDLIHERGLDALLMESH